MSYWDDEDQPIGEDEGLGLGRCPRCGAPVSENGWRYECEAEGCGWGVWREIAGYTLTPEDVTALLEHGETPERRFTSKAGKPFQARLAPDPERWREDGHVVFVFAEREAPKVLDGVQCPLDGHPIAIREKAYSCTRPKDEHGEWCPVVIWREVAGHRVTEAEAKALLQGQTVGPVQGKSRKTGKTFRMRLTWNSDDGVQIRFEDKAKARA